MAKQTAEQLTQCERWALMLGVAPQKFLRGHNLQPPQNLLPARDATVD